VANEASERIHAFERQPSRIALAVKRGIDVSLSALLGLVALPLMLLIATAIRLDSPGPALFRASRIGRLGQQFSMFKFRTMVSGAEQRLHEVAHLNLADDGMVKIPDDPRVTRIGRFLRRFSLDELPQLYNILLGDMSIVGPRPHDVSEFPENALAEDPRLSMKPGLTGLWQVRERSNPSIASRIYNDRFYVKRWSLVLDAKILAMTVPAVLLGKGGKVQIRARTVILTDLTVSGGVDRDNASGEGIREVNLVSVATERSL
jgi:lipopolysaccharide/colanic/teichoic acid biosynthesis glycosyltransferase